MHTTRAASLPAPRSRFSQATRQQRALALLSGCQGLAKVFALRIMLVREGGRSSRTDSDSRHYTMTQRMRGMISGRVLSIVILSAAAWEMLFRNTRTAPLLVLRRPLDASALQ